MQTIDYEIVTTANPIGLENCILAKVTVFGHESDTHLHWHHALEMTYILSGGIEYLIDGQLITATAGDFTFINSGSIHQTCNLSSNTPISAVVFVIPDTFLSSLVPSVKSPYFDLNRHPDVRAIIATYLQQIATYLEHPVEYQSLLIQKELLSVTYQLFSKCYTTPPASQNNQLSKQVLEYVELHYSDEIKLSQITGYIGLQENYFCRYFKKQTGISFHQYLCKFRLQRAISLLLLRKNTITECALEAGFSSEKIFIDWCKKEYQCTPTQYLKAHSATTKIS